MTQLFARIFLGEEQQAREAPVQGLRYAQVDHLDDDGGYILNWLSGNVSEPSMPARVATLMAGSQRGSFFMPEPGDEVVVGFEDGNLDSPVILGALWNDEDDPPTQADTNDSNNVRTLVSRSGHEVTFNDDQDTILIKIKNGPEIKLESSAVTITASGNPVKIVCDKLTVEGDVDIQGDLKVIGSSGSTTISGHEITGA